MGQVDTGQGGSLAVTGFAAGKIISVGSWEETVERVPIPHLGTTAHVEYMPGDYIEHGEIEAEFYWEGTTPPLPNTGGKLTQGLPIVVTFPSNGTLSGPGFVTKRRGPELQLNQPQIGVIAVSFDGRTSPAYSG